MRLATDSPPRKVEGPALMTTFGVLARAPWANKEAAAKAVNFIVSERMWGKVWWDMSESVEKRGEAQGNSRNKALFKSARHQPNQYNPMAERNMVRKRNPC